MSRRALRERKKAGHRPAFSPVRTSSLILGAALIRDILERDLTRSRIRSHANFNHVGSRGRAHAILSPRTARTTPAARLPRRRTAPHIDYSNNRLMPNGDPTVFGIPCRFPAAPSIRPRRRVQGFDQKRFFGSGRAQKKLLPCVSLSGREGQSRRCRDAPPQEASMDRFLRLA